MTTIYDKNTFDNTKHFTAKQISLILNQDKKEIETLLKEKNVVPVGKLRTGQKGRPSNVYSFDDVKGAFSNFENNLNNTETVASPF
jgi:hypothetical protein